MNWKKGLFVVFGAVAGFALAGYVVGQEPGAAPAPEGAPGVVLEPGTEPVAAEVADDAKPLLEQLGQAYKSLKSVEMTGSLKAAFDVGGEKVDESADFTASYAAPNQFRHEMKDSLLMGATGKKVFVYSLADRVYKLEDETKGELKSDDLMYPIPFVLARQNPSLMLVLSQDPAKEVIDGATRVVKGEDTTIGDTQYPTLQLQSEQGDVSLAIDPKTHLLRRMTVDMKRILGAQGQEQVKQAQVVFDYTSQKPGAEFGKEHFDWSPPEGAQDAAVLQNPTAALVGKDAPGFALKDLEGKDVSLSDQKGKVVVLDFWATWCPPCVVSLPDLDRYAKTAGEEVKVFAVNLMEDKQVAQEFMQQHKLSLPVLLDGDGEVAQKYLVQPIPATVVVGRDGKIAASFVGPDQQKQIEQAVQEALKQ